MSEYLDGVHDNTSEVYQVAEDLHDLAVAFNRTGNETVARKLSLLSAKLYSASRRINTVVSQELNRSVQQAQENSANLVRGVLAGIELGQNEDGVGDVSDTD